MDKYVVLIYDASGHDPCAPENVMTSPILIRQMCEELMDAHDVHYEPRTLKIVERMAQDEGMTLRALSPIHNMAWGDWLEVARDKKDPNLRLYIVKVVDEEITEIDRRWRNGQGGGW